MMEFEKKIYLFIKEYLLMDSTFLRHNEKLKKKNLISTCPFIKTILFLHIEFSSIIQTQPAGSWQRFPSTFELRTM